MKTEVNMVRELFGHEIKQKSKSEFFSATDLVKAGNAWRLSQKMQPFSLSQFWQQKSTKEFVDELIAKYGNVKIAGRGRGSETWVHPILFIEIALSINPKLKIQVYEWLYDHLLKYRNDSGTSYKDVSGALYKRIGNKTEFPNIIKKVANYIKKECGVTDWNKASEKQLEKRDRIHRSIITLSNVLTDYKRIVMLAVKEHKS